MRFRFRILVVLVLLVLSAAGCLPVDEGEATSTMPSVEPATQPPAAPTVAPPPPEASTPQPESLPYPQIERVIFADDFEDGDAEGWLPHPAGAWRILDDDSGNHFLLVEGRDGEHAGIDVLGPPDWGSISATFRLRMIQPDSTPSVAFQTRCVSGQCAGYSLVFWPTGSGYIAHLSRAEGDSQIDLMTAPLPGVFDVDWHTVRIESTGGSDASILVAVDGMVVIYAEGDEVLPLSGGFQLGSWNSAVVVFDDVVIEASGPAGTPSPMPQAYVVTRGS